MQAPSFKDLGFGLALGGATAVAVGSFMFMDDVPDFPEVISTWGEKPGRHGVLEGMTMPWLPPHIHHWLLGFILLLIGAVLLLLGLIFLVKAFILKT